MGITACLILTVSLITAVFYNHPATTSVTLYFRTVPILPETNGRRRDLRRHQRSGHPGFADLPARQLQQEAAVETARRKVLEAIRLHRRESGCREGGGSAAAGQGGAAAGEDELDTKQELYKRNPGVVPFRDIEKLQVAVDANKGAVAAAAAAKQASELRISDVLPAEKASAQAALDQAQVDLDKTIVRAGVSGRVEQFMLRVGDIVNPLMRPAGVLIPEGAGQRSLQAGFGQIEAQIMKVGMIAEVTCVSKPFAIIPMVVTDVQDYIAAGQFRGGEQLIDLQQVTRPGTLLAFLEPLYQGGLEGVTPGSSCIANAYSSNHDVISAKETTTMTRITLHVVDALALVHALILRLQALVLPFKTLVFSGH